MANITALSLLILSGLGSFILVAKKINALSDYAPPSDLRPGLAAKIKQRIKTSELVKKITPSETLLLKILSWLRIYILKSEHKVSGMLSNLRQKTMEKNGTTPKVFNSSYWEQLKAKRTRKHSGPDKTEKKSAIESAGFHEEKIK